MTFYFNYNKFIDIWKSLYDSYSTEDFEGGIMLCVRLPSSNIRTQALLSDKFVVVLNSI